MSSTARPGATEPPVALAFLGDGWSLVPEAGAGARVFASAICDSHRCVLPSDDRAARDAVIKTLAWVDETLARGWMVAGYLGYELGAALEGIPAGAPSATVDAQLTHAADRRDRARCVAVSDPGLADAVLVAFVPSALHATPPADMRSIRAAPTENIPGEPGIPLDLQRQRATFIHGVQSALRAIGAGRYYQLNLSCRFETSCAPSLQNTPLDEALALLRRPQPVPYGMAMQLGEARYFSLSMERFVSVRPEAGQRARVRSRPIKGTTARGQDAASDHRRRDALLASAKERAENTMIVDMVRNDLSRVAAVGGVRVTTLLDAVSYNTLWHLESEVEARVLHDVGPAALLSAILPPASVTGCPKVAAMRAIADLEDRRRGPYCGALGVWHPDGRADLSVGIRGVVVRDERAWLDVGAGIVADSEAEAEWDEVCLKARAALAGLAVGIAINPATGRES